jgi:hypothetical protein
LPKQAWLPAHERGFIEDWELMQAVRQGGQYPRRQILDVSGALFRQLLDGGLGKANRRIRMKLHFQHREFPLVDVLMPEHNLLRGLAALHGAEVNEGPNRELYHWHGPSMNPERTQHPAFPTSTRTSSLDQWLAQPSGVVLGETVTVADNIRVVRHVLGGGHHGTPKGDVNKHIALVEDAIEATAQQMDPDGTYGPDYLPNGPVRQIVFIAGVTAAGLTPLVDALRLRQ